MFYFHVLLSCTVHVLCSCTNFIYYIHVLIHLLFIYYFHILFSYYTFHITFSSMPINTKEVDTENYKGLKALYSLYETVVHEGPKALW